MPQRIPLALTTEGIATHESGGCPDPETCACEGQWPYFPKYGMIYMGGVLRPTTEEDLERAAADQGLYPVWWTQEQIDEHRRSVMTPHEDYKTGGFVDAGGTPKNRIDRINREPGFPSYWDETKIKAWRSSMGDKPFHEHVDNKADDSLYDQRKEEDSPTRIHPKGVDPPMLSSEVKFPGPSLSASGEGVTASRPVIEHVTVPVPDSCDVEVEDDVVMMVLRYRGKEERHAAKASAADLLNAMGVTTTL